MKFNKLMRVRAICNFYHTVIYLFKTAGPSFVPFKTGELQFCSYVTLVTTGYRYTYGLFSRKNT